MGTLANTEDLNEIPQLFAKIKQSSSTELHFNLEFPTCNCLIYTRNHDPKLIVRVGSHVVFCLDTLCRYSNTLYGHSDRTLVDFSMFSHLYPESYTPFFSPHFSRSNATRISSLSFLL